MLHGPADSGLAATGISAIAKLLKLIGGSADAEGWRAEFVTTGDVRWPIGVEVDDASGTGADTILRTRSGVRRNEPCPYGRGKRYKNCHGARHQNVE